MLDIAAHMNHMNLLNDKATFVNQAEIIIKSASEIIVITFKKGRHKENVKIRTRLQILILNKFTINKEVIRI